MSVLITYVAYLGRLVGCSGSTSGVNGCVWLLCVLVVSCVGVVVCVVFGCVGGVCLGLCVCCLVYTWALLEFAKKAFCSMLACLVCFLSILIVEYTSMQACCEKVKRNLMGLVVKWLEVLIGI